MGEFSRLKIILSDELNIIRSTLFKDTVRHNNATITLSAERKKGKRFGAVLLLRETLDDKSFLVPDFSAGFEFRVMRGEEHFLKFNFSRNTRIPSMNDRYYNPGGNPDLKNEHAFSCEIGYKLDQKISSELSLSSELNYFRNYIRDMIQWHPDDFSNYVADNIGRVNTSGLESSLSVKYRKDDLSMDLNGGYSYTKAVGINDGELVADQETVGIYS